MLRIAAILMLLLLAAGAALAAAFLDADAPNARLAALGLGLGQVQVLAAALVFARRWLLALAAALGAAICFWSALAAIRFPENAAFIACLHVSAALLAALWCGWNWLLGLRLAAEKANPPAAGGPRGDDRRGQFSLATALLAISVFGVYLAMWRVAVVDAQALLMLLALLVLVAPGCVLLTIPGHSRCARMRFAAIIACYCIALLANWERGGDGLLTRGALTILAAQTLMAAAAAGVLRVAGVRLVRQASSGLAHLQDQPSIPGAASQMNPIRSLPSEQVSMCRAWATK